MSRRRHYVGGKVVELLDDPAAVVEVLTGADLDGAELGDELATASDDELGDELG